MENQGTNPTPEQWQQEQAKRYAQPPAYNPPPYNQAQSFTPPEDEYPQRKGSKFGGGFSSIIVSVLFAGVLCYAMISLFGITPTMKQYKADITRLELDLVSVRDVNTQQAGGISALQGAITTANTASTKATSALELSNALQTQYGELNTALTALQGRVTDLESNSGDIYDDTIVKGLINAVEDDITAINTTIVALQAYDTTNTTNISALQSSITTMQSQITALQGGGTVDLTAIQNQIDVINHYINDADTVVGSLNYQLAIITGDIQALYAKDVTLQNNIDVIALDDVSISYYSMPYIDIKINKTGDYAIILTIYGNNVDNITIGTQTGYTLTNIFNEDYGAIKTMKVVMIVPQNVTVGTSTAALTQWTKGQTYTMRFSIAAPATISCIDIDTAFR